MPGSIAWHFLVAGGGLEPSDLRVMSPTSYQLLYPAVLGCKGKQKISISKFFGLTQKILCLSDRDSGLLACLQILDIHRFGLDFAFP